MIINITLIELRSPLNFFAMAANATRIKQQLKGTTCISQKTNGFWTKHYTMTAWDSFDDMKKFVKDGAHLKAIKISSKLAKVIRTVTLESDALPDWKEAKYLLYKNGKVIEF